MRKSLAVFAILAFSAAALAEEATPGRPSRGGKSTNVKDHPVLSRLGLTDEQTKKVEDALAAHRKKVAEDLKAAKGDGQGVPDVAKIMAAAKGADGEANKVVREALPEELRAKFDVGAKIVDDFTAKNQKLNEEFMASAAAGGDKDKMKEAQKAFKAQSKALVDDMNKELDEKVGKRPEAPKGTKG